jgi:hypothetical protein
MVARKIILSFDGYWREVNERSIPPESGIYLVYVCRYNETSDEVTLDRLIYIGEAGDVNDRIVNHADWPKWRRYVPEGSEICFAFAGVTKPDREFAEAALIYYHKPPCNVEYVDSFPFEDTTVESTGKCAELSSPVTVRRTP